MRWASAAGDRSVRAVLDLAASLGMQSFDTSRPLVECFVVEGLAGDRAALIQKLHHSLTDGIGGVLMLQQFYDAARDAPVPDVPEPATPPATADESVAALVLDAVRSTIAREPARAGHRLTELAEIALHPLDAARHAATDLESLGRMMSAGEGPLSPVMQARSGNLQFDLVRLSLADLKAAAHAAACKLSDAFLAGTAAGWRLYHERHGAPVPALRAAIPLSQRTAEGIPVAGINMAVARVALPIDEPNPGRRMRSYRALIARERDEPAMHYSDTIATLLNSLPLPLALRAYRATATRNDFVASSVPGVGFPLYMAGAAVESMFAFGPPSGAAVNLTLMSYLDQAIVTINSDVAAVPDPGALADCMRDGFASTIGRRGAA